MVSNKDVEGAETAGVQAPVVLSEGAGVALGSVFNRLIKPKGRERASKKTTGKRPRSEKTPIVLAESDEVQKSLAEDKQEQRKYKEAKKAKLKFENNALVIPDAATNAALEKELLATATKGAVALFNAVSKAQKLGEEKASGKAKKKGPPVSRESFMDMMRAGVSKDGKPADDNEASGSEPSDDGDGREANKRGAKWLKNDFLTAGSRKLKDWDREAPPGEESSSSDDESDDDEKSDSQGSGSDD